MRGEIHARRRIGQQVVEGSAAGRRLQALDAAEAAVVEHHDGELRAERHRGGDLRIQHQVAAVADQHAHLALRAAPASRPARRRSRSPCRSSRIPGGSWWNRSRATACAARRAGRRRRTPRWRSSAARRLTTPSTCASVGFARVGAAISLHLPVPGSRQPRGLRRSTPPAPSSPSSRGSSASRPASRVARPADARHAWRHRTQPTLSCTSFASANSAREPVAKSPRRVPIASTRSARAARVLAAAVPVTPIAPALHGWSQARLPLPAWVSADRDAVRLGERGEALLGQRVLHAAAGDDQGLSSISCRAAIAAASSSRIGQRRGECGARGGGRTRRDSRRPRSARPAAGRGWPGRTRRDRAARAARRAGWSAAARAA